MPGLQEPVKDPIKAESSREGVLGGWCTEEEKDGGCRDGNPRFRLQLRPAAVLAVPPQAGHFGPLTCVSFLFKVLFVFVFFIFI